MIKVTIEKENNRYHKITISGHSDYGVAGTDIVCAAVSSIVTTTVNAIVRVDSKSIQYEEKEGFVSIVLEKELDMVLLLIENMLDLLQQLEQQYSKDIKINKEVSSC